MSSKAVFGPALVISSLLLANVGYAEQAPPVHKGPWPIRNGRNYQPTENELRALHLCPSRARHAGCPQGPQHSLAELEAAAILTVSLLRAFFDRRINPAAKESYPWERPRPRQEALCGKRLWPCSHWQRSA